MEKNIDKAPAVIFDFGGVLMDWSPYYLYRKILGDDLQAINQFLEEVDFTAWNLELDRGLPFSVGMAELSARFPQYHDLIFAYGQRFAESVGGANQPVVEILDRIKKAGYPLFGLSNWNAESFAQVRPNYLFFEWFDGIVLSGEVGLVKPDRAIFEVLLREIGRPAEQCLMIDDATANIQTAHEMGFQTILYQSPQQLEVELDELGILNGSKT